MAKRFDTDLRLTFIVIQIASQYLDDFSIAIHCFKAGMVRSMAVGLFISQSKRGVADLAFIAWFTGDAS